jgi:hypothetical protein
MRVPAWFYGIVLAAAVAFGAWLSHEWAVRTAAEREIQMLRHSVVVRDSIYVRDTLIFNRYLKAATTLHDSITLKIHDTLFVERLVAAQDSTIKACTVVIQDCNARVASRDSLIKVYQKAMHPSRISLGIQATCGYGLGGKGTCVIGLGGSFALTR